MDVEIILRRKENDFKQSTVALFSEQPCLLVVDFRGAF
jgi:hypothetical protein